MNDSLGNSKQRYQSKLTPGPGNTEDVVASYLTSALRNEGT